MIQQFDSLLDAVSRHNSCVSQWFDARHYRRPTLTTPIKPWPLSCHITSALGSPCISPLSHRLDSSTKGSSRWRLSHTPHGRVLSRSCRHSKRFRHSVSVGKNRNSHVDQRGTQYRILSTATGRTQSPRPRRNRSLVSRLISASAAEIERLGAPTFGPRPLNRSSSPVGGRDGVWPRQP